MKKSKFLLLAFLTLLLTGCSLARAESVSENDDRWVGFYAVPTQGERRTFFDNPYLEEYGAATVNVEGIGNIALTDEVLFAVKNEAGNYSFPGMDTGFSLFYVDETHDYGPCTVMVSNMGPHDDGASFTYKDEGSMITLSGTIYCGPPLDVTDWDSYSDNTIWTFYRVYETEDERVYINGDGSSVNGPMSHTQSETRSVKKNGETVQEETFSVTVAVETVPRIEHLVVTQFDENHTVLLSEDLSLWNDQPEIHCLTETAWVLVEEVSTEGTERTIYSVPEDETPVSHDYILLDEDGYGHLAYLNIYAR